MKRFWVVPTLFAALVIGPFLIWGDTLTALFSVDGAAKLLDADDGPWAGFGWLIGIGLLVGDLFLPIPTTAVIAALGIAYGPVVGAFVALAGTLAAATLGYGVGRFLGRPVGARLLGSEIAWGERAFARYGGWIVAASRWAPVLPEVVSCVAGVSRMPFGVFLFAVLCGGAPLCILFAYLGHLGAATPGWTLAFSALAPLILWAIADRLGVVRRLGLHRDDADGDGGAPEASTPER
ncbi:MAG: VTT domain-containing protein [Pseudomonadota bacterium]